MRCPIGRHCVYILCEQRWNIIISQMDLLLYFRIYTEIFTSRWQWRIGFLPFFYLILLIAFTLKLCKLALARRRQLDELFHRHFRCSHSHSRYFRLMHTFGLVAAMEVICILAWISHNRFLWPVSSYSKSGIIWFSSLSFSNLTYCCSIPSA